MSISTRIFITLFNLLGAGSSQIFIGFYKEAVFFFVSTFILNFFGHFFIVENNPFLSVICLLLNIAIMISAIVHFWIKSKSNNGVKFLSKNLFYSVSFLVCCLLISFFSVENISYLSRSKSFHIPTESMEPTVLQGDYIYADMMYFEKNEPKKNQIAVIEFENDNSLHIERIVGFPNDTLKIENGDVYINGIKEYDSAYTRKRITFNVIGDSTLNAKNVNESKGYDYGPSIVPENKYFVLGDNRDNSLDSRFIGFVPRDKLKGIVLFVWWSTDFSRIGKLLNKI